MPQSHTHARSSTHGTRSTKTARRSAAESAPSKTRDDGAVQDLLDRFARALTAGDGEACADVWETPAFVIGRGMARPVTSRDEVVEFFGSGKQQYAARGIVDTRAEVQELDWISDDLVVVRVRWPYLDASGDEQGQEESSYTLLRDPSGTFKIRAVLMRGATQ
jgi:hypothetical protein